MTPIVAFVSGLLVGWLVEWVIDWIYWRRQYQKLESSSSQGRQKVKSLEAELSSALNIIRPLQDQVRQLELEKAQGEIRLTQMQEELETARTQSGVFQPALPDATEEIVPDNLQEINGIGLVITKRLNHHGIYTFEQLASQTAEYLREILGDMIQRLADEESFIQQARQLAYDKQIKRAGEK